MSFEISNIIIEKTEESIDADNLIKNGIDIIYKSFQSNIGNYEDQIKEQKKIINELSKKLELMKQEMEMIQRENLYYKTQNEKLKNEIENLNKIVNSIKGKLTNFDFKLNNKKIIENLNHENLNNLKNHRGNYNFKNYFKKKNAYSFNSNTKYKSHTNFNRENSFQFIDNNNSNDKNIYDIKNIKIDDINGSELNNIDINFENIYNGNEIHKINNFMTNEEKKLNYINEYNNININKNQKHPHTVYNHLKTKIIESNDLSNISGFPNNFNIKKRERNKNYNKENIKLKKHSFYSFDISSVINNQNNNNINFNNNQNEINLQKKLEEKNKIRSNSSNIAMLKNNRNQKLKGKSNTNRVKEKVNSLQIFDPKLFFQGLDNNNELNKQICKTQQNQKKIENKKNNLKGSACVKELRIKEMEFFLKKCKIYLDQTNFEKLLKIFKEYKNRIFTDEGIIQKMKYFLENNSELLNLYNKIIS